MLEDRIYQSDDDGQWYFNVRRNQAQGPFVSEAAARAALKRHVRACQIHHSMSFTWPRTLNPMRVLRRPTANVRQEAG